MRINPVNFNYGKTTFFKSKADGVSSVEKVSQNYESKKPQFLYHFTDDERYEDILKDGFITPQMHGYGFRTFMVDMKNFKETFDSEAPVRFLNAAAKIFGEDGKVDKSKKPKKVIILEVPVANLQEDSLDVRHFATGDDIAGDDNFSYKALFRNWHLLSNMKESDYLELASKPMEFSYISSIPVGKISKVIKIDIEKIDQKNPGEDFFQKIEA